MAVEGLSSGPDIRTALRIRSAFVAALCPGFETSTGHFIIEGNTTSALTQGTSVRVDCHRGLLPFRGVNTSTCDSNGKWTPHAPQCDSKSYWL